MTTQHFRRTITILVVLVASFAGKLLAQTPQLDSLVNEVETYQNKDTVRVNLLNQLTNSLSQIAPHQSIKYIEESISLADELNYKSGKAEALRQKGRYSLFTLKLDETLIYLEGALRLFQEIGDKSGSGQCLNGIAGYYQMTGNYYKAVDNGLESLKIFEEINDKENISKSLSNLGAVYYYLDNYDESFRYYTEAIKIQEELGNEFIIAVCLNNIADIYVVQKDYDKAIENQQKSLDISKRLGITPFIAGALTNLANSHRLKNELKQALEYYKESLAFSQDNNLVEVECESHLGLAQVYFISKNLSLAKRHGNKASELAIQLTNIEKQERAFKLLADVYGATQEYKLAYEYHTKYKAANDSIFNEQNIKKITGLEYQYEFDKEKQQIALEQEKKDALSEAEAKRQGTVRNAFIGGFILMAILAIIIYRNYLHKQRANVLLGERYDAIKSLQETKNKIFTVISHDLRGPVSSIKSFTHLIEADATTFSNEEILEIVSTIGKQSNSVFNTLDNLLYWVNSQQGGIEPNFVTQPITNAINNNVALLEEIANRKQIKISNHVDHAASASYDVNLISTVVRNLIANAIKFTPKNGSISIEAHENGEHVNISITDTGVGIESERIQSIFDKKSHDVTRGTDHEKGTGLGLKLSMDFIEMHGGKLWVKSEVGQGSTFGFSLAK